MLERYVIFSIHWGLLAWSRDIAFYHLRVMRNITRAWKASHELYFRRNFLYFKGNRSQDRRDNTWSKRTDFLLFYSCLPEGFKKALRICAISPLYQVGR